MSEWDTLRDVARSVRALAPTLPEPVTALPRRYPLPQLWQGPAADRFAAELHGATRRLNEYVDQLLAYSVHLEREADRREREHRAAAR